MSNGLYKKLRLFGVCLAAWMLFGLFFFSEDLTRKLFSGDPTPWWHFLLSWATGMFLLAVFTPGIFWLGERFRFERRNWRSHAALHLLFSICFALADLGIEGVLLSLYGVFPEFIKSAVGGVAFLLVIAFHQTVFTYWLLLGAQYAWRSYRLSQEREKEALRLELRTSELQSQLVNAKLGTLKMQLQPHFLFNTLNAIMVLVRQRKAHEAEQTIALFSDLLRLVLDDVETQQVPLHRELEYLRLYLAIEQVRFQDRMRVELQPEAATLDASVPHMCLQPIVENAIRHGIGASSSAGRISIRSQLSLNQLLITVQDDGPGLPPGFSPRQYGIGLANTQARLEQLYGSAAQLVIQSAGEGGTLVTMALPYQPLTAAREEDWSAYELEDADRR